jgi:hypothetical protein
VILGLSTVVLGASPAMPAPPPPSSSVSCDVGGSTVVSWKHRRVDYVKVRWYNSTFAYQGETEGKPKGPKFSAPTPTGVDVGGQADYELYAGTVLIDSNYDYCT